MVPALVSSEHAETVAAIRSFASPHSISDLIGILCFLPERDNLLMWSHYADSHKGYALEFKASRADFKRLGPMWRVTYDDDRPVWRNDDETWKHFFCKIKIWDTSMRRISCLLAECNKYRVDGKTYYVKPLPIGALTAVYFEAEGIY
jgi:hypothetical protein